MKPEESPQVGTESFTSAVVIPQSYTAYRDETCDAASKVPLPTFPNTAELEVVIAADRELSGIIKLITKIEAAARDPLNARLKKLRSDRDDFLTKVEKEHERLAAGITAFQQAKYLHDQAEARRLADEARKAEAERWKAEAEIKRQQEELERLKRDLEAKKLNDAKRAELEAKQKENQAALVAAQLAAQEAEFDKASVATQLAAPTNTPRNLTTRVRYDFEIVKPIHLSSGIALPERWRWNRETETLKFDRAGFLKDLNSETANPAHAFLPPDGEREVINTRVGIRVFIDVRANTRA